MDREQERGDRKRVVVLFVVVFVLAVSGYRMFELSKTSTGMIARGEARWYSWAYREKNLDVKFRDLGVALGERRSLELVVRVAPFDEVWWEVMCLYYLPGYRFVRIGAEASNPPSTLAEAIVTYDGKRFSVAELQ